MCVSGPDRLRVAEPLTRFVTGLRVYANAATEGSPSSSAGELGLRGARFVLVLSPEVNRGFSGEGGVLASLADDPAAEDAGLIAGLLAWDPRIEPGELTAGLPSERAPMRLTGSGPRGGSAMT